MISFQSRSALDFVGREAITSKLSDAMTWESSSPRKFVSGVAVTLKSGGGMMSCSRGTGCESGHSEPGGCQYAKWDATTRYIVVLLLRLSVCQVGRDHAIHSCSGCMLRSSVLLARPH